MVLTNVVKRYLINGYTTDSLHDNNNIVNGWEYKTEITQANMILKRAI